MTDEEYKEQMLDIQLRNQALLETILQTQIRILSKVKKERYEYTKKGIQDIAEATERALRSQLNLDPDISKRIEKF